MDGLLSHLLLPFLYCLLATTYGLPLGSLLNVFFSVLLSVYYFTASRFFPSSKQRHANMPPGTQVTAIARAAADTPTRNLGPLTTVFTPSPVCSSLFSATLGPKTFGMILGGQCDSNSAVPDASDCCPPAANSDAAISTGDVVNKLHRGYYSPGLYCPAGYTTACSATGTDDYFAASFMYPPGPSDTAIGCCPT